MLQAIVFDFDGTILETEGPDYQSWQEIFDTHGGELTLDVWIQCVGGAPAGFDPFAILEEQTGIVLDRPSVHQARRRRVVELIQQQPPMPGVEAVIRAAQTAGIGLAVASSSPRVWVEGNLNRLGLRSHFQAVRTADDVERVKPDPALYRLAAAALDSSPARTLAIEDSRTGMLAAKGAGLHCLVVPNSVTQFSDFSQADLRLTSLADLTPTELFNHF
ncbi:MAG: HAD-IA family hydrolase [Caldilineaceae bacterium]|nr:HAD-IA family hydrolase [Caldilineaceae bacterium]